MRAVALAVAFAVAGVLPVATAQAEAVDSVIGTWERILTDGCVDGPAAQFLPNSVLVLFKAEGVIEAIGPYEARPDGSIIANRFVPWPMGEQPPDVDRRRMAEATFTITPAAPDSLDVTIVAPGIDAPGEEKRVRLLRCPK